MSEHDGDWGEAERKAFEELAREESPPREVENRIVHALERRGLLRPTRRRREWRALGAVAAGLLLVLAGFVAGRSTSRRAPTPPSPRFTLLLLRGTEPVAARPEEEAGRVSEYRAWARGLAREGRFVEGEKLEDRGARLRSPSGEADPTAPSPDEIRGFFVISAPSFEDALAVARECPHLRYGGTILVRPIAG
jgi:hypothetical protein